MPRLITQDIAQPVGSPRATPETFGADVARATVGLGQQISNTGRIIAAADESEARHRSSQFRIEMRDAVERISLDQDIENRDQAFQSAERELRERLRGGNTGIFDRETTLSSRDLRSRLNHRTNLARIEKGRVLLSDEIRIQAGEAARADNEEDRTLIEQRAGLSIQTARNNDLIDDGEVRAMERSFVRQQFDGRFELLNNTNPLEAYEFARSREGDIPEAIRQERMAQATRAHELQLAQKNRDRAALQRLADEEDKERAMAIERDLIRAHADGTLTTGMVLASLEDLSPDTGKQWIDVAAGGSSAGTGLNREVYNALYDDARNGIAIEERVSTEYAEGNLTLSARNGLIQISEDRRFDDARDFLKTALRVGELSAGQAATVARQRSAQGQSDLEDFILTNPKATRTEVMEVALTIRDQAALMDSSSIPTFQLQPSIIVRGADGSIDRAKSLRAQENSGMTPAQLDQEYISMERLIEAEEKRANRGG